MASVSIMEIIKYNLDRICRVCMAETLDMRRIFGCSDNICDILMTCSSIQLSENDGLPSQICAPCVHQANSAVSFKQQCERSDTILRNYIKTQHSLLSNIKQEQTNLPNFNEFHDLFKPEIDIEVSQQLSFENQDSDLTSTGALYQCGVCGAPCLSAKELTGHILEQHTGENIKSKCHGDSKNSDQNHIEIHIEGSQSTDVKYKCEYCCEIFENTEHLVKHKASHNQDHTNFCLHCDCGFLKLSDIRRHNKIYHNQIESNASSDGVYRNCADTPQHSSDGEFSIEDLLDVEENKPKKKGRPKGKRGPKKGSIRKTTDGIERKKDIVILICELCNEEFKRKLHLKRHMESAHGEKLPPEEKIHECTDCKKAFAKVEHLKRHMKNHAEKIFDCDECPKKFSRLDHLTEHKKRHTGERSFLCSKCGKGYFKQSHLDKHMLTHLNDHLEKPVYECTICGKKLNHSNHLQVHMRTHRDRNGQPLIPPIPNPNKKVILCSVCGKSCSSRSNLAVHMRRHTGQMTNFCKICGKGYPRTTDLTLHMRQHTGERPFVCSICNRGFARSDKLAIHMRTHTGEKPYVCPTCGRAFAQSNDLASHKRRNMCGQSANVHTTNNIHSSQINTSAVHVRAADLMNVNVVQRLDRELQAQAHNRAAEMAHSRAVELAAQAAAHHSRVEYTDYTTATLLQNLSSNHFMR